MFLVFFGHNKNFPTLSDSTRLKTKKPSYSFGMSILPKTSDCCKVLLFELPMSSQILSEGDDSKYGILVFEPFYVILCE